MNKQHVYLNFSVHHFLFLISSSSTRFEKGALVLSLVEISGNKPPVERIFFKIRLVLLQLYVPVVIWYISITFFQCVKKVKELWQGYSEAFKKTGFLKNFVANLTRKIREMFESENATKMDRPESGAACSQLKPAS